MKPLDTVWVSIDNEPHLWNLHVNIPGYDVFDLVTKLLIFGKWIGTVEDVWGYVGIYAWKLHSPKSSEGESKG